MTIEELIYQVLVTEPGLGAQLNNLSPMATDILTERGVPCPDEYSSADGYVREVIAAAENWADIVGQAISHLRNMGDYGSDMRILNQMQHWHFDENSLARLARRDWLELTE